MQACNNEYLFFRAFLPCVTVKVRDDICERIIHYLHIACRPQYLNSTIDARQMHQHIKHCVTKSIIPNRAILPHNLKAPRRTMSSTTPSSKGDLLSRTASAREQKLIDDILPLYQLKPSHQAYSHYTENAVFHDPVSIAKGLESIKSQFNGMPKVFSESTTERKTDPPSNQYRPDKCVRCRL